MKSHPIEKIINDKYGVGIASAPREVVLWAIDRLPKDEKLSGLDFVNKSKRRHGQPFIMPEAGTDLHKMWYMTARNPSTINENQTNLVGLSDLIRAGRLDEATRLVAGEQMNESIKPTLGMHAKDFKINNAKAISRTEGGDGSIDDNNIALVYEYLEKNNVDLMKKLIERADSFIINLMVPYIHPSFYDALGFTLFNKDREIEQYAKRFGLSGVSKIGKPNTTAKAVFGNFTPIRVGSIIEMGDGGFIRIDALNIRGSIGSSKHEAFIEHTWQDMKGKTGNSNSEASAFFGTYGNRGGRVGF